MKDWWRDLGEKEKVFKVLSPKNVGKRFIIFGTETTGHDPAQEKIIQISAIRCEIEEDCLFSGCETLDDE